MIKSFKHKGLKRFFESGNARGIQAKHEKRLRRMLCINSKIEVKEMSEIKESDWKIFKTIKEEALDSFCSERLREYEGVIKDASRTAHERYLHLFELCRTRDKEMELLFNGHSRSRAFLQLLAIRGEGLANPALVDQLSEDFRMATDPARFEGAKA